MFYVEWLRVRNALRVTAIVLGIFIALALIGRIIAQQYLTYDQLVKNVQLDPGTKQTHTMLPDGTHRVTFDDPNGTQVVIDDRGYSGKHIVITEPAKPGRKERFTVGSVRVVESGDKKTQTIAIDSNVPMLFAPLLGAGAFVAFLIATVLAAPLARENDGHLEIALTRPRSRQYLALGTIAVDVAGIVLSGLMTIVAATIMIAMFQLPRFDFQYTLQIVGLAVFAPLAWYAMLCAATASLKRNYGAVLGFAWPVAFVIPAIAIIPFGDSIIGGVVHQIFWAVSRIDPITYASVNFHTGPNSVSMTSDPILQQLVELALFVVYVILAVAQWRRVEA